MDGAGLSARAAANQLRHSDVSTTQDVYMGRRIASTLPLGHSRAWESPSLCRRRDQELGQGPGLRNFHGKAERDNCNGRHPRPIPEEG